MREAGRPALLGREPPAGPGLRRAGLQPLGRARLHQRAQPGRPGRGGRCARPTAAPATRWWWPAATAPSTPSPWPTSSTPSCWATARRWWARSTRWSAAGWPGPAPAPTATAVLRALARVRRGLRPRPLRAPLRRRRPAGGHRAVDRPGPGQRGEAHRRRPGRVALPPQPAGPADRGGPRPAQRRGLPGLHPGLPVLPGRDDHPPRPRAPGRPGAPDGARRPGLDRLRRGGPHLAVDGRLLGDRGHRDRRSSRTRATAGGCRSACPACGWTPSPWARRPRSSRSAAPASTFAPEGGTWRMRQVINKLIREEDLYGAVDAAFSQGWRRVKLYFLIGLPTERDEDVLGIAELGQRCVEIGRRYHRSVTVVASVGGFVPKPHTPFQWFGQDTVAELRRKVAPPPRGAARGARGLTLRWHDPEASVAEGIASRGDRRIGRGHRAGVAGRGDLPGVVRALRPRAVGGGPGRRGADRSTRWSTATAAATRPLPWDHISAGLHRDFLWERLAGRPGRGGAWRTAAGPRATTAAPAPASASSTSWPRRCRRPAGSQGTGQDLARGGRVPVRFTPPGPEPAWPRRPPSGRRLRWAASRPRPRAAGGSGSATPSRARSASPATGTWPGCGSGPCGAAGCRWPGRRGSPPARCSASAWPCPPGASRWPSTSTSASTSRGRRVAEAAGPGARRAWPAPCDELLPEGIEVQALGSVGRWRRFSPAGGNIVHLGAGGTRGGRSGVGDTGRALLDAPSVVIRRERKGRQVDDDLRPSVLALAPIEAVAGPERHAGRRLRAPSRAGHPAPRGPPRGTVEGLGADLVLARACRTHQWIERDGARWEPLASSGTDAGVGRSARLGACVVNRVRRDLPHVRVGERPDPGAGRPERRPPEGGRPPRRACPGGRGTG